MSRIPLFVLLMSVFFSCGPTPAVDRIYNAEQNLRDGDFGAARRDAEKLVASADTAALSAAELCRLAMVYATVGDDAVGNETDVAMAARCIRRALAIDSAAVDSFIHAMPVEQRPLMSLAVQLCIARHGGDIVEYEDSAAISDTTVIQQP